MSTPFGQLMKEVSGNRGTTPVPQNTDKGKNISSYMQHSIASRTLPETGNPTISSLYPNIKVSVQAPGTKTGDKLPVSTTNRVVSSGGIQYGNPSNVMVNAQSTIVNQAPAMPTTVIRNNNSVYVPTGVSNNNYPNTSQSTYVNNLVPGHDIPTTAQSQFNPITATNARNYDQFGMFTPVSRTFNHDANPAQFQKDSDLKVGDASEYIGKIERQLGDQRVEGGHLKKQLMDLESRHKDLGTQYNMLSTEFSNLRREYDALCAVKGELHATQLELEKMKTEKDFHHEQHLMLRRDLLNQLNKDYENDQLKREKNFVENELRASKEKSLILEKQIEELLVFAQRPKENEEGGREFFFAKKIVKLEDDLERTTAERNQFKFEVDQLKQGIRAINHNADDSKMDSHTQEMLNDTRLEGGTDGLLDQLKHLKRKNDMLSKENQLIRKELDSSLLNRKSAPSEAFNNDHYMMEDLKQENHNLKQKIDKLQEVLAKGAGGRGGDEKLELILEQTKMELMKLREENTALRVQGPNAGNNIDERLTKEITEFYEKIARLEKDNEDLRRRSLAGNNNNSEVVKLQKENKMLKEENKTMRSRIELLQKKLDEREREIRENRLGNVCDDQGAHVNSDNLNNLMEANERLMKQMHKMQGQLNRHDSIAGFNDVTEYSINPDFGNNDHHQQHRY